MPLTKSLALTQLTLWFQNFNWQTPGHRAGFLFTLPHYLSCIPVHTLTYHVSRFLPVPFQLVDDVLLGHR